VLSVQGKKASSSERRGEACLPQRKALESIFFVERCSFQNWKGHGQLMDVPSANGRDLTHFAHLFGFSGMSNDKARNLKVHSP
jgi:hypothetical protein